MATENYDPENLINSLESARRALDDFTGRIADSGDMVQDSIRAQQVLEARAAAEEAAAQKERIAMRKRAALGAIEDLQRGVTTMSSALMSGAGSFGPLTGVVSGVTKAVSGLASSIPYVGKALGAAAQLIGDSVNLMIQSFEKAYGEFEKLSDVGVVRTFQDLKTASDAVGLNFADTNKVLSKYSKDLSRFGGTVEAGRKQFELVAIGSKDIREQFQRLGISASEFSDMQLAYMTDLQRAGRLEKQSDAELIQGTKKYIEQLDMLSKVTGLSRKDVQAQRDAALSETRFFSALSSLGPEAKKSMENMNLMIQKSAPSLAQGFRDLTGGAVTTDAAKQLVAQSGGAALEIIEKVKTGQISEYEGNKRLQEAVKNTIGPFKQLGSYIGDASLQTRNMTEADRYAMEKAATPEDLEKTNLANRRAALTTDDLNAKLADTKTAMYNAGKNLEAVATSSDLVASAMKYMAKGLEFMTEQAYEMAGKDLPAHLQARKDERIAIEEETKAKQKLIDLTNKLPNEEKKLAELKEKVALETDEKTKKILDSQIKSAERNIQLQKRIRPQAELARDKAELQKEIDEKSKKVAQAAEKRQKADGAAGVSPFPSKAEAVKESSEIEKLTNDPVIAAAEAEQKRLDIVRKGANAEIKEIENKIKVLQENENKENAAEIEKLKADKKRKEDDYTEKENAYDAHLNKLKELKDKQVIALAKQRAKEAQPAPVAPEKSVHSAQGPITPPPDRATPAAGAAPAPRPERDGNRPAGGAAPPSTAGAAPAPRPERDGNRPAGGAASPAAAGAAPAPRPERDGNRPAGGAAPADAARPPPTTAGAVPASKPEKAEGKQVSEAEIEKILATIREKESGGNYSAQAKGKGATASGAYQFIDSTWQSLSKKYGVGQEFSSAKLAPKEVQDKVARGYVQDLLKQAGGDVSKVPLAWYSGNIQGKMSEKAIAKNNGLTPGKYQNDWMEKYSKADSKLTEFLKFTSNSGKEENFNALDARLKDSVIKAAMEYNQATGKKIQVNSAKRDPRDQQRLWDETVAAGRTGFSPTGMPVGKPGTSKHERGLAIDIQNYADAKEIMNKYGLFQTVKDDPVHFTFGKATTPQARDGGIFTGPKSGYGMELHGTEAVVPLPDGKTIPITVNNSSSGNESMTTMFNMMEDRLSRVIDLLSSSESTQRKILNASM